MTGRPTFDSSRKTYLLLHKINKTLQMYLDQDLVKFKRMTVTVATPSERVSHTIMRQFFPLGVEVGWREEAISTIRSVINALLQQR